MIMVNLAKSWLTMVPLSRSWQIMIHGTLVKIMARSWQDNHSKTYKLVLIVHNLFFSRKFQEYHGFEHWVNISRVIQTVSQKP